jgi:hypothetical protein
VIIREGVDEAKRDTKLGLQVPISRLIAKENHVLIGNAACLLDAGEMLRLVPREDLDMIEIE